MLPLLLLRIQLSPEPAQVPLPLLRLLLKSCQLPGCTPALLLLRQRSHPLLFRLRDGQALTLALPLLLLPLLPLLLALACRDCIVLHSAAVPARRPHCCLLQLLLLPLVQPLVQLLPAALQGSHPLQRCCTLRRAQRVLVRQVGCRPCGLPPCSRPLCCSPRVRPGLPPMLWLLPGVPAGTLILVLPMLLLQVC